MQPAWGAASHGFDRDIATFGRLTGGGMGKRISSGTVSRLAISLRSSFWFLPAMMVSAAIALALALVALDRALGTAPAERLP